MTPFLSLRPHASVLALLGASALAILVGACSRTDTPADSEDEHLGSNSSALTGAQCSYFDVTGKDQICHYTGSGSHPYTILKTSEQGCISGHAGHPHDYIVSTDPSSPTYDPTCQGGGCLPAGAPTDGTLGCCDGLVSQNGTCVDLCAGVTCAASDQCHVAGTCNPANGACSNPAAADGTTCNDDNSCTITDACVAGTCTGSGNPCLNGGTCSDPQASFTCTCTPSWTGPTCGIAACVPTTCAAHGATCGTLPDGCGGTLTCGGACGPVCPCDGNSAWQAALAGMIVTDGRCTNYSFPGPCGSTVNSTDSFSWAVTQNGSSLVELLGGTQFSQLGASNFCGVQVMQPSSATNCSGGSFPVIMSGITAMEAASCKAEILALAAAQSVTCH